MQINVCVREHPRERYMYMIQEYYTSSNTLDQAERMHAPIEAGESSSFAHL